MFRKLKALSVLKKIGLGMGALIVVSMASAANQPKQANLNVQNSGSTAVLGAQTNDGAPKPKAPVVTIKTETETQPIPYLSTTITSATLPKGQTKITTPGVNGVLTLTYEVTYANEQQTNRKLVSQVVTTEPVTQVTSIGTYVAPRVTAPTTSSCDPNYTGCVPIASDVDCAGGSGNGPAYVQGPIRVIGYDIYNLDADNDGIACE